MRVTVSYNIPSTYPSLPFWRVLNFYSPDLGIFFTSRPDSIEAREGLHNTKGLPAELEMQTYNFCPKKSWFFQWTFSGRPGSMLDSFSSCSIAKQHGRPNIGKQGSRERGSPRKISRSTVLTIFLCLTSYTLSLSLSDHCRMRWHLPHNRNSGETG